MSGVYAIVGKRSLEEGVVKRERVPVLVCGMVWQVL